MRKRILKESRFKQKCCNWKKGLDEYSTRVIYFHSEQEWREFVDKYLFFMIWDIAEELRYDTPEFTEEDLDEILEQLFEELLKIDGCIEYDGIVIQGRNGNYVIQDVGQFTSRVYAAHKGLYNSLFTEFERENNK